MSKLWYKGCKIDELVESFTVGDDYKLDRELIFYDCVGSIAHARMLKKISILDANELESIVKELKNVIALSKTNSFEIKVSDEDVHTAVENYLTKKLGDLGKKLHTARSRNDQVMLDLRLYMKDYLLQIMQSVVGFAIEMITFAEKYQYVPIPGRTHFQKAMPSSMGLWAASYAESMIDNMKLLQNAYDIINQSPLGSASGYGVNLAIDRQLTSDLLGFKSVQNNVAYCANSRGKFESIVVYALSQVMIDISKLCTDVIIFSAPEFGYLKLPEKYCSGSSLMPQKKNPCGFELARAKASMVLGYLHQLLGIISGLPSGYNRDFQETKKPLMQAIETTMQSVAICRLMTSNLKVNSKKCIQACTKEIFATDLVLELSKLGTPFRDAYKKVGMQLAEVAGQDPVENIKQKKHRGATGNLGLHEQLEKIKKISVWVQDEQDKMSVCLNNLLEDRNYEK